MQKTTNRQLVYIVVSITIALGSLSYSRFALAEAIKWDLNNSGNIGTYYQNLQPVSGSNAKPSTSSSTGSNSINGTIPIWKLITNPKTNKPYDTFQEYISQPTNNISWDTKKQAVFQDALNNELNAVQSSPASKEQILSVTKNLPISEQNLWLLAALSFGLSIPSLQRLIAKMQDNDKTNRTTTSVSAEAIKTQQRIVVAAAVPVDEAAVLSSVMTPVQQKLYGVLKGLPSITGVLSEKDLLALVVSSPLFSQNKSYTTDYGTFTMSKDADANTLFTGFSFVAKSIDNYMKSYGKNEPVAPLMVTMLLQSLINGEDQKILDMAAQFGKAYESSGTLKPTNNLLDSYIYIYSDKMWAYYSGLMDQMNNQSVSMQKSLKDTVAYYATRHKEALALASKRGLDKAMRDFQANPAIPNPPVQDPSNYSTITNPQIKDQLVALDQQIYQKQQEQYALSLQAQAIEVQLTELNKTYQTTQNKPVSDFIQRPPLDGSSKQSWDNTIASKRQDFFALATNSAPQHQKSVITQTLISQTKKYNDLTQNKDVVDLKFSPYDQTNIINTGFMNAHSNLLMTDYNLLKRINEAAKTGKITELQLSNGQWAAVYNDPQYGPVRWIESNDQRNNRSSLASNMLNNWYTVLNSISKEEAKKYKDAVDTKANALVQQKAAAEAKAKEKQLNSTSQSNIASSIANLNRQKNDLLAVGNSTTPVSYVQGKIQTLKLADKFNTGFLNLLADLAVKLPLQSIMSVVQTVEAFVQKNPDLHTISADKYEPGLVKNIFLEIYGQENNSTTQKVADTQVAVEQYLKNNQGWKQENIKLTSTVTLPVLALGFSALDLAGAIPNPTSEEARTAKAAYTAITDAAKAAKNSSLISSKLAALGMGEASIKELTPKLVKTTDELTARQLIYDTLKADTNVIYNAFRQANVSVLDSVSRVTSKGKTAKFSNALMPNSTKTYAQKHFQDHAVELSNLGRARVASLEQLDVFTQKFISTPSPSKKFYQSFQTKTVIVNGRPEVRTGQIMVFDSATGELAVFTPYQDGRNVIQTHFIPKNGQAYINEQISTFTYKEIIGRIR